MQLRAMQGLLHGQAGTGVSLPLLELQAAHGKRVFLERNVPE